MKKKRYLNHIWILKWISFKYINRKRKCTKIKTMELIFYILPIWHWTRISLKKNILKTVFFFLMDSRDTGRDPSPSLVCDSLSSLVYQWFFNLYKVPINQMVILNHKMNRLFLIFTTQSCKFDVFHCHCILLLNSDLLPLKSALLPHT